MSLTSNFDFCVQLGIAQVQEIFHLAFKDESRYPHNVEATRLIEGHQVHVEVMVHDDETAAADLSFQDAHHMRFSFPFDLTASIPDAPDPALSRITMHARVEVPALLTHWPEEGEEVLGLDFAGITPGDVTIVSLEGLPAIGVDNFRAAIHRAYDTIPHVYDSGANRLVLYCGARDLTLDPPNAATPAEIEVALETHGGVEYLKVTAPIHVSVPVASGGSYQSYGRIIFWRRVERGGSTIAVIMNAEPADPALQTQVQLDTPSVSPDVELAAIEAAIHTAYDGMPHEYTQLGNTLIIYDDARDITLDPPNAATPYEIEGLIETHSAIEYLKVTLPIHVDVPLAGLYTSYGRIIFWRAITRTATTVSVNFAVEPAPAALKTIVELDSGLSVVKNAVAAQLQPLAVAALAGFGTISTASAGSVAGLLQPLAVTAINAFGVITEPAFSEAEARARLQFEIAEYLRPRKFPVYSPKSGDESEPLSTPVGFLLVTEGILAILLNRRSGNPDGSDDVAPDAFLGSDQVALAVGPDKVHENIIAAMQADPRFEPLTRGETSLIEVPEGSATLKSISITLADPGAHDQPEGHLWVTGEAEVHIDCWPDPDVSFSGPIFIRGTPGVDDAGACTFALSADAGEFDIDQSCCDVLIDLLIPIVGIVMLIIVEQMIDEVGGELVEEVAEAQGRQINAFPPVVNGVAEVQACLVGVRVSSQGFVLPGTMSIRRLSRSFEDLESRRGLPRP